MSHHFTMLGATIEYWTALCGRCSWPQGPVANEEKSRLARVEMALGVKLAKA